MNDVTAVPLTNGEVFALLRRNREVRKTKNLPRFDSTLVMETEVKTLFYLNWGRTGLPIAEINEAEDKGKRETFSAIETLRGISETYELHMTHADIIQFVNLKPDDDCGVYTILSDLETRVVDDDRREKCVNEIKAMFEVPVVPVEGEIVNGVVTAASEE